MSTQKTGAHRPLLDQSDDDTGKLTFNNDNDNNINDDYNNYDNYNN